MKQQSLKRQAALITGVECLVRAMGFLLRLWISRLLGAEAVGVVELASGAHMLALAPAASGLPGAVSRLTAKARGEEERQLALFAGKRLALRMALLVTPLFLILSPRIAQWLGDERTLPSLVCFAPCVLFIGLSSVYDGYCLGSSCALPPAMSELGEQIVRLTVLLAFAPLLPRVTAAWRAALPAFSGLVGEGVGLVIAVILTGPVRSFRQDGRVAAVQKELWALSLPMILNRLCHTGMRALSNWLIPRQLVFAGLDHREALSRLGMLNGMVMPLMFLPGLLAGSLAVVGGPAAARCKTPAALRALAVRLLGPAFLAGAACAGSLYALSPLIAHRLYRLAELAPMIRALCPMAVLLPVQQVLTGLMNGLGLQKKILADSLLGAFVSLLFTFRWTAAFGILGAGYAALLGHGVTVLCAAARLGGRFFRPDPPQDPE